MSIYRLIGNLWLQDPQSYLSVDRRNRLQELRPHLDKLESCASRVMPGCQRQESFDLSGAFEKFADEESALWSPARPKDELVMPSGSLEWPLAHHLHNPSFATLTPSRAATADASNPCTWQIMASSPEPHKTLIFDHLARREVDDGLAHYPEHILACHERWLTRLRQSMSAYVEVCYGRDVEKRIRQILNLEAFELWADFDGITLYFEWEADDNDSRRLVRVVMFAVHPQIFCQPWGARYSSFQDKTLSVAHQIAKLDAVAEFYKDLKWTFVLKFPRQYPQYKERSCAAHIAVTAAQGVSASPDLMKGSRPRVTYKPGSWNAAKSRQNLLADPDVNAFLRELEVDPRGLVTSHSQDPEPKPKEIARPPAKNLISPPPNSKGSKISALIDRDPSKPSPLPTRCRICGEISEDPDPRWHLKTGKYVAKKRKCVTCSKSTPSVPADNAIKYVQYSSLAVGLSRIGKTYFRPWAQDRSKISIQSQIDELEASALRHATTSKDATEE